MRYLSLDIEATGLSENDLIIELGIIPFDSDKRSCEESLSKHYYVQCPSFDSLKSRLDPWVIKHNKRLIEKAHSDGLSINSLKEDLEAYLTSKDIKGYFKNDRKEKITLFGKSMNSIDLPFLTRDFTWEFMRKHFHHRILDLSSTANTLVDMNLIPDKCTSGSGLMEYLEMGEVCHTALEDARNTAIMYFKLLEKFSNNS